MFNISVIRQTSCASSFSRRSTAYLCLQSLFSDPVSRTWKMEVPGTQSETGEKKAEEKRSYFDVLNPWSGTRSSGPSKKDRGQPPPVSEPPNTGTNQAPANHAITHLYGQSFSKYPEDCPPLTIQWYYAVDVPKKKPSLLPSQSSRKPPEKPLPPPKKYVSFSTSDSQAIETAYQKLLEDWESERDSSNGVFEKMAGTKRVFNSVTSPTVQKQENSGTCIPVNEDYLFEVNIEKRELNPIYWLGPTYDVRRGTWFYQEGSALRPCEENLAAQLEEGFLKLKPWNSPEAAQKGVRARSGSAKNVTPKSSLESLKGSIDSQTKPIRPLPAQPPTYRLFGTYMNYVVTYQDASTAWLLSDGMFSWVTSYLGGTKLVRGYANPAKTKEEKAGNSTATFPAPPLDEHQQKLLKRRSAPPLSSTSILLDNEAEVSVDWNDKEALRNKLTRKLSGVLQNNPEKREEFDKEEERMMEEEMEHDYNGQAGESQGRNIEHLILVTHGIGQLLSARMDSINFVHDINTLRKTIKNVYANSADLRALNVEVDSGPGNCRIQVLPVCWRHLLNFPRKKEKKTERDVSDGLGDEDEYPSLDDITVEGMAFARSLISDLALDVLLYQSAYRAQISEIVQTESNRIFNLFKARNPEFKGKVHIMGHSLGSAIMFDLLCRQKERTKPEPPSHNPLGIWPSSLEAKKTTTKDLQGVGFSFDVADFYCLGSPIGLFQMLKGRTIAARRLTDTLSSENLFTPYHTNDPLSAISTGISHSNYPDIVSQRIVSPVTGLPFSISSPKVAQLFNIFHPSDPIAYRIEPLISPMMRDLKPQAMPYTKKSIFGAMAPQGLTGIGAKVGQSVNSLWSSVSAGITTSFLNRSLGLTSEDVASINSASRNQSLDISGTDNVSLNPLTPGFVERSLSEAVEKTDARKKELASSAMKLNRRTSSSGNELTLLDDELETLYSKFEKNRGGLSIAEGKGIDEQVAEQEKKGVKARREEMKVRALNRNGRVDFCIQELVSARDSDVSDIFFYQRH